VVDIPAEQANMAIEKQIREEAGKKTKTRRLELVKKERRKRRVLA